MTAERKQKPPWPLLLVMQSARPLEVSTELKTIDVRAMRYIHEGEYVLVLDYTHYWPMPARLVVLDEHGAFGFISWYGHHDRVLKYLFDSDIDPKEPKK